MRGTAARVVLGLHRTRPHRELLDAALSRGITALDTAFNYDRFGSHAHLRRLGAPTRFSISTKVGFFPRAGGGVEHSLDPARLHAAITTSVAALGAPPEVVLLHSPERSLPTDPAPAAHRLRQACQVLEQACRAGWCGRWGIASWDPRPIRDCLPARGGPAARDWARPDLIMTRAGLLTEPGVLHAIDDLAARWALAPQDRWGMSPFAGNPADPVWSAIDPRRYLAPAGARLSRHAAAFRAAFALPAVHRIAVGVSTTAHLDDLLAALEVDLAPREIQRYRALLAAAAGASASSERASRSPAAAAGPASGPP